MPRGIENPFLEFLYQRGHRLKSAARAARIPLGTLCAISSGTRRISDRARAKLARALRCEPGEIPDPLELASAKPTRRAS